jgi:Outer membrane protein beta-barrel domain
MKIASPSLRHWQALCINKMEYTYFKVYTGTPQPLPLRLQILFNPKIMIRKILTLFCVTLLALASLPGFSQVKLGVKAGVSTNSAGVYFDDSEDEKETRKDIESRAGFTLGLAAEYGLSEALSLQTGLQLSNKGYKLDAAGEGGSTQINTSLTYLEIPLHFAYKISQFQVHAGPYLGLGVAGKAKYDFKVSDFSSSGDIKYKFKDKVSDSDMERLNDEEGYMRRLDVGLNLGLGYRVGPALISLTYARGISDIFPTHEGAVDDDDKLTNKGLSLTGTWFF